jgi:putative ABC transport system permease protein
MIGVTRLLYRSFRSDRGRTAISIAAIAAAIVLVVVLEGFKSGLYQQVRTYREQLPATFVALPAGTSSISFARAGISPEAQAALADVPGVRTIHPLVVVPSILVQDDNRAPITVVGYRDVGGPARLVEGRNVSAPGEMVMDWTLARRFSLRVGDAVELFGMSFRIVGFSDQTASMIGSYVFIHLEDIYRLTARAAPQTEVTAEGTATAVLLEVGPGINAGQVRQAIAEAVPQVNLVTPTELADSDVSLTAGIMGSTINVLIVVAYVVGVLVISLTLYAAVLEHTREHGVMKAIGAGNGVLLRFVLGQTLIFTVTGFALGLLAAGGAAWLLSVIVPQYLVLPWESEVLLRAGVAAVAMAGLASIVPVRQVANVEPAMVFRQ